MTADGHMPEDGEFGNGTSEESTTVYPLVEDGGNQRVLREWLSDHDSYALADEDRPVTAGEFDLCIVDQKGLRRHKADLQTAKATAEPALLPVLLLVSEIDSTIMEEDRGEIADNVFATTVDELISLPIRQAELEWRIQALLRLRNQSLALRSQTVALRRFREAVEASGHAIWISDADGVIEYVNPAFEGITGYSSAEAVGERPDILNSGEMPDEHYDRLWDTVTVGDVWREEIINRRKDGEKYIADQTIAPIVNDDDAEVSAYVAVQTDITDQKALQDRLKRHRDIVQRLEDPIMLQDESGAFTLVNESLAEFAGMSEEELLGEDEFAFMDEGTATMIERRKRNVIETETPVRYGVSPDFQLSDEEAVFSTSRYPYYDDDDELAGTLAICRDVTGLEERTRQLRVLDNVLRHNIRNSLNVIRGRADQIRAEESGESAAAAETIVSHADDLLSTSEKSRAVTAVLSEEADPTQVDLAELVRSVGGTAEATWPDADVDVETPERVVVSVTKNLETAVSELVKNAITHNDRDPASVELRVAADDETATVSVVDDGPGIPDLDREVLTSGEAIEALTHGSGLGLWLVYWIVKRSEGSIRVEDVEPRGTAVTITFRRISFGTE